MHHPDEEQTDKREEPTSLLNGNRELAVLYDIAGYLNRQIDVHKVLQEVLRRVTELLGLRTGWVWLLDEQGQTYLAAGQNLPPYLADHPERLTGSCVCLDTFLSGTMGQASNIDAVRCSRLKNAERDSDPSALGLRFHASVPIHTGDTALGVMNVTSEDWRELRPDELQMLHIISDQIGLAIQRAQLSAEHTRAATQLATTEERNRLAREIHDTLAQGLAAITRQLESADTLLQSRSGSTQEAIQKALQLARENLKEARRSVMDLRATPPQTMSGDPTTMPIEELTERELEVLRLVAQGMPNKEIASYLIISERTAKFHVSSIMSKLGATNRTEAVALAAQRGLITLHF
jgi:two-component system NarL family sensor kinase